MIVYPHVPGVVQEQQVLLRPRRLDRWRLGTLILFAALAVAVRSC